MTGGEVDRVAMALLGLARSGHWRRVELHVDVDGRVEVRAWGMMRAPGLDATLGRADLLPGGSYPSPGEVLLRLVRLGGVSETKEVDGGK